MNKVVAIIPARLRSKRFPGKMLMPINGKPLIYYTWKQVGKSKLITEVFVATDSQEIAKAVIGFGGRVIFTSARHLSGTDRVMEAVQKIKGATPNIVVNVQGDEPLISPGAIDSAVRMLIKSKEALVSTVATRFNRSEEVGTPSLVKVVMDKGGNSLYFSRSAIPFSRTKPGNFLKHIGVYGFRSEFIKIYLKLKPAVLEKSEELEQLRILENGYKIKVAVGDFYNVGVDTEDDFKKVKRIIEDGKHSS